MIDTWGKMKQENSFATNTTNYSYELSPACTEVQKEALHTVEDEFFSSL